MIHRKKNILWMVIAFVLYALEAAFSSTKVYYSAKILDWAQQGSFRNMMIALGISLGALAILFLIDYLNTKTRLAFVTEEELGTKRAIMHSVLHRPISSLRSKDDAYYFNLLTTDIDTYRQDYLGNILLLFSWICYGISSSYMLFILNPWLLLTGVLLAAIPILTNNLFTKISKNAKNNFSEASERYAGALQEIIKGFELVQVDGSEEHIEKRFDFFSKLKRSAQNRYAFVQSMSSEAFYTFAALNMLIGVGVGGYLVIRGQLSAIMMLAAESYFATLSNAFANLTAYVVEIRATKDVRSKLQNESQCADSVRSDQPLAPVVEYENVDFSFGDRKILEKFNETFAPGKAYAIIGESGCGKSTLFKLLLRYYDSYTGTIKLGGRDIRQIPEQELYSMIGYVDQSAFLFNASLYENITMFSGAPAQDSPEYQSLLNELQLQELAKQVGAQPLGDFGEKISGGERQRINIARALRSRKPIMVFDEPTTGLDPENANIINTFILHHVDATRIVITHDRREEYLQNFDHVIQFPV